MTSDFVSPVINLQQPDGFNGLQHSGVTFLGRDRPGPGLPQGSIRFHPKENNCTKGARPQPWVQECIFIPFSSGIRFLPDSGPRQPRRRGDWIPILVTQGEADNGEARVNRFEKR